MSLFKRISDNIRANINSLLDKAEDPEKMLDQYLRDMAEDITDAEAAVARQLAVARKFKAQMEEALNLVEKRGDQAVEALQKEREDLARKALEDKKVNKVKAENYRRQYENNQSTAELLKSQLKEMKSEYEKLRVKREVLAARAQSAKAQKEIYGVIGSFGQESARRDFERMEDKVLRMEAEAQVAAEFSGAEKSLDEELKALGDDDIDQELASLKESLLTKKE
ncbi:PspA/IM30 family protein [Desulforamulus ruminis]|uniref:PspA/IM30 family protein n=1 Tax=Desulforamulus ruminis TaxID=1564 RepID=UPI00059EAA68|nr:PspA/IM30 family protein [Desulforamulus ruminis]